eukprot:scaffold3673_cov393-Prasinococcus_capsulatus_cf.AAC.2
MRCLLLWDGIYGDTGCGSHWGGISVDLYRRDCLRLLHARRHSRLGASSVGHLDLRRYGPGDSHLGHQRPSVAHS